jgi:hypothetical protein
MGLKGGEVGTVSNLRKSLKRGEGTQYLTRVPGDDVLIVRFLTEPDHWFKYYEHFDENHEPKYFPCSDNCEGCADGLKSSKRYLVNAVDVDENKTIPLVLPSSLASSLLKKYDRFHTITDRNYELSKEGQGYDTEYSDMYDTPSKMKLNRYDLFDLGALLESQLSAEDDDDEGDEDEPPRKARKGGTGTAKKVSSRRRAQDDDDDEDDDEDEAPPRRIKKTAKKSVKPSKSLPRGKQQGKKTLSRRK